MPQNILIIMLCFFTQFCWAQKDIKEKKEPVPDSLKVWFVKGKSTLLFNQSAFNKDFATGGVNSLSLDLNGTFELNYDNAKWRWDNKISAAYGVAKVVDEDFQKTNDQLQVNTLVGLRASKNWDYSFFSNLRTQFASGREGVKQRIQIPATGSSAARTVTIVSEGERNSQFFSPAILEFGPGMSWKKGDDNNFKFNLAPVTSKFTLISSRFTQDKERFGVDKGESKRYELGASARGYLKFKVLKMVSLENILNLYSNYIEDAKNVDLDYLFNMVIKVNKYITSNFTFQTIYDDNTTKAFQVRESFGLGLNYDF